MQLLKRPALCVLAASVLLIIDGGCGGVGATPGASLGKVPSNGPVGHTIKANASKFEACARDAVSVQTESTQSLQLKFTIDAEGKVTKASIENMSEPDPDLYTCVIRALKRLQFPKPQDGISKIITYPLILKPE